MVWATLVLTAIEVIGLGIAVQSLVIIPARLLFILRLYGMDVSLKLTLILEAIPFFMVFVWRVVWKAPMFDVDMFLMLFTGIIIVLMQFYNAYFYVYTEEDLVEETEE